MKSDLPVIPRSELPGFRKVVPKEVFLAKLEQKRKYVAVSITVNDRVSGNVPTIDPLLWGVVYELNRSALSLQQNMLIATYLCSFWFFGNLVLLFPFPSVYTKPDPPHLRIVRSR
jgi:hypothetical protein